MKQIRAGIITTEYRVETAPMIGHIVQTSETKYLRKCLKLVTKKNNQKGNLGW